MITILTENTRIRSKIKTNSRHVSRSAIFSSPLRNVVRDSARFSDPRFTTMLDFQRKRITRDTRTQLWEHAWRVYACQSCRTASCQWFSYSMSAVNGKVFNLLSTEMTKARPNNPWRSEKRNLHRWMNRYQRWTSSNIITGIIDLVNKHTSDLLPNYLVPKLIMNHWYDAIYPRLLFSSSAFWTHRECHAKKKKEEKKKIIRITRVIAEDWKACKALTIL